MFTEDTVYFFFFFSSRRRHTRYWRDWSSDVCSSDLAPSDREPWRRSWASPPRTSRPPAATRPPGARSSSRSEERRVGKECRSRWSRSHEKKKRDEKNGGQAARNKTLGTMTIDEQTVT